MTLPTFHLSKKGFQLSELTEDRCKGYLKRKPIKTYHRMRASMVKTVLIPPDLHAGEILTDNNSWTQIDPKPYIGDPTYDVTQHLLNCTEHLMEGPLALIDRMASITDQDPDRIRFWLFARLSCASVRTDQYAVYCPTTGSGFPLISIKDAVNNASFIVTRPWRHLDSNDIQVNAT